jgi:hypothetical protein
MLSISTSGNFWGINNFNNTINATDGFENQFHKQQYNLNNNPSNIPPD